MTDKEKLQDIKKALQGIIAYPVKGVDRRRTKEGYPTEIIYDKFSYERMVTSYRKALKQILADFK